MAGLEGLVSMIYHEKQQSGSMLCAQHALNSLLQGNYFTAPDLSELARNLDHLENAYDEETRGQGSANMDDTGFFSVQVLENALDVWGLNLIRWRSEAMKSDQSHPHTQLAFVLNHDQHWYTLRRFGHLAENFHWFNLDSSRPSPQWISKTYLGMFLQQAERDGYSVFVIVPNDPEVPLPHTDADDLASTLPEPSSASSATASQSRTLLSEPGFEDEDMDLQAALQASLMGDVGGGASSSSGEFSMPGSYPPPLIPSERTFPGFLPQSTMGTTESQSRRSGPNIPPNQDPYGNADVDPVTASIERNRIIMERMRREQEMALREQYEEEIARFDQAPGRSSARQRQGARVGEGDEDFRRAMERSIPQHRAGGDNIEVDESDDEDYVPVAGPAHTVDRVYDDDDAEFQAALKASLETVPAGFTVPPSPQPPLPRRLTNIPLSNAPVNVGRHTEESEIETETETDAEESNVTNSEEPREVGVEEMRRRRLARFGG
ncbi:Josephin-domain-containing protein [Paxillus ammoniavirescens]|nr:Josephin-domain-containing protein [Paxillus ammoniavirescens]